MPQEEPGDEAWANTCYVNASDIHIKDKLRKYLGGDSPLPQCIAGQGSVCASCVPVPPAQVTPVPPEPPQSSFLQHLFQTPNHLWREGR